MSCWGSHFDWTCPITKKVAHIIVKIRKQRVAVADERIEIVSAMLQDIKITKLNNYEDQFEKRVQDARRRELEFIKKEQVSRVFYS